MSFASYNGSGEGLGSQTSPYAHGMVKNWSNLDTNNNMWTGCSYSLCALVCDFSEARRKRQRENQPKVSLAVWSSNFPPKYKLYILVGLSLNFHTPTIRGGIRYNMGDFLSRQT